MKLRSDWKKILRHAWSVRLMTIVTVLASLEAVLPYLPAIIAIEPGTFAIISGVVSAAAVIARLLTQSNLSENDE